MNNVIVYERPGLQEFLARASSFAEVIIFTAGLEGWWFTLCRDSLMNQLLKLLGLAVLPWFRSSSPCCIPGCRLIMCVAVAAYASPLIDKIDPERTTTARLYRSATVVT